MLMEGVWKGHPLDDPLWDDMSPLPGPESLVTYQVF